MATSAPVSESDARAIVLALGTGTTPDEVLRIFARETARNSQDVRCQYALRDAVAAYGWTLDAAPSLVAIFAIWADMAIAEEVDTFALDLAKLAHEKTGATARVMTKKGAMADADAGHIDVAMLVKSASGALETRLKAVGTRAKLREELARAVDRLKREGEDFASRNWDSQLAICARRLYEEGDISAALALASRIRRPDTVSRQDVEPLALAVAQRARLEAAADHADRVGDTAALVQLQPALSATRRDIAELEARNKPADDGPEDPLAAGLEAIRKGGPDRLP